MDSLRLFAGHFRRYRRGDLQDVASRLFNARTWRAATVTALVNGSLALRRAVYVNGVLGWRQYVSRRRYARLSRSRGARGAVDASRARTLSLLCPTRERPDNVQRFVDSVRRTAALPRRVEVLFYIDADDPRKDEYLDACRDEEKTAGQLRRCEAIVGDPMSVSKSWNILAQQAGGDLLMMANDDQIYVDYGWDVRLDEACDQFPDGIVCMYFDDGQYAKEALSGLSTGDFPIVTRRWYEELGYFTPGIFEFWSNDNWILDIARRLGRLHAIPGVFVDHLHYDAFKSPYDRTYRRHRSSRDKSARDFGLYLNTARDRQAAVDRLRAAMARSASA